MARNSTVAITQSAFTDNRALADGGAIHNEESAINVQNSTFSGNRAARGGVLVHVGGTSSFGNATLVGNAASTEGGGISGTVVGVTLNNTILAGNRAPLGTNCLGRFASEGYNLLGDLQDCTVLGETTTNLLVDGKEWENLARTDAGTYAHLLTADSRALGAGSCQLRIDQRGAARPTNDGCDIGAIEAGATPTCEGSIYLPMITR